MRKRDRWAGAVWLNGFQDEIAHKRALMDAEEYNITVQMALEVLTEAGYLVEIEGREGQFKLRLLPVSAYKIGGPQMPAASYCSARLKVLLAAAVYELEEIALGRKIAVLSNRERIRWVGP